MNRFYDIFAKIVVVLFVIPAVCVFGIFGLVINLIEAAIEYSESIIKWLKEE